jgi:tyrosyl-tRNA synthetase
MFTLLPLQEIESMRENCESGIALNKAKRALAYEATKITHGEKAAEEARAASAAAFGKAVSVSGAIGAKSDVMGDITVLPTTTVPRSRLEAGISPAGLFTEVGLTPSRKEAKRMIEQGGLYVNDERVDSVERLVTLKDLGPDGGLLLKAGKKKVHRVVAG